MTALAVAFVLVFCCGIMAGLSRSSRPLPPPAAPPSLAEHVATLREIIEASGELTPEVEAWIALVATSRIDEEVVVPHGKPMIQIPRLRLPAHQLPLPLTEEEIKWRHGKPPKGFRRWKLFLDAFAMEADDEARLRVVAFAMENEAYGEMTTYEQAQIVQMFTTPEARERARVIVYAPRVEDEEEEET